MVLHPVNNRAIMVIDIKAFNILSWLGFESKLIPAPTGLPQGQGLWYKRSVVPQRGWHILKSGVQSG